MSQFTVILLIAIFSLISLFVWNGFNFRALKKMSQSKDKELNDAKYWELKYKYEFMIAVVALITATAGFLGYNSLQSIEGAVRADFNKKVDSVKNTLQNTYSDVNTRLLAAKNSVTNIDSKVKNSQLQLKKSSDVLTTLRNQQFELKESGYQSKRALGELSVQIDSINTKNKIKREFYLIPNMPFSGELQLHDTPVKLKFAELRTISGDRLPTFKKPPIVISALSNTTKFEISSINTEGFEGMLIVYGVPIDEKIAKSVFYNSFIIYPVE